MKFAKLLILSLLFTSCGVFNAEWPSNSYIKKYKYERVISEKEFTDYSEFFSGKIDVSPMYPNGVNGLLDHIGKNFKYPESARLNGIQGKVYVSFNITTEGNVEDIKVVKTPDEIFNNEAVRVVSTLERWIPAQLKGEYVEFTYTIPINLKLE